MTEHTTETLDGLLSQIDTEVNRKPSANDAPAQTDRRNERSAAEDKTCAIQTLSVLVPVYNERWTLEEILDRVLESSVSLELEVVVVDDGSTDGSWELVQELARDEPRIKPFRHDKNRGKGAAIRTAIDLMQGDVAIIQDADLEYDPGEYGRLLQPILEGKADAVFGSRFVGTPRRVLKFWHGLINATLTLASNMLSDLNLTDMETCFKMVRADVLKELNLKSNSFAVEPELTARLSQWGARIYEVPISYSGRSAEEGKKIRAIDGLKAVGEMLRCRFIDPCFTSHTGMYVLRSVARANRYNHWVLDQCREFLGKRVLEAGSGIGNLSHEFFDSERLLMVDCETEYIARLTERYGRRRNVRVVQADLTDSSAAEIWQDEELDTVFCSNVLEHLEPDEQILRMFHESLTPGGHCIIVVPAGQHLYTGVDADLGHHRRYSPQELHTKMQQAGLEVVFTKQFCRLGAIAWWINGNILRRRNLSPRQMIWFDRLWPLTRLLDACLPVEGMSLMMIGRRPSS